MNIASSRIQLTPKWDAKQLRRLVCLRSLSSPGPFGPLRYGEHPLPLHRAVGQTARDSKCTHRQKPHVKKALCRTAVSCRPIPRCPGATLLRVELGDEAREGTSTLPVWVPAFVRMAGELQLRLLHLKHVVTQLT